MELLCLWRHRQRPRTVLQLLEVSEELLGQSVSHYACSYHPGAH